jgi:UDP-2,4-diacetamido-2,4,6-trideoxy-beta-L-altropyranose hydrolase
VHIIFRTDASLHIGTGHVMRCLTLADCLKASGASCRFVSRSHPGHLHALIEARGHDVEALDASEGRNDWLGAGWADDAAETAARIASQSPDWLVVDHYGVDARWEASLRGSCRRTMVIDDLADRLHDCDVLLDQNWFGSLGADRYRRLVPADCELLLGPAYALLKPEYAAVRASAAPRNGHIHRVAVFMGGSDPDNQTAKVLDALSCDSFAALAVDVVIGVNHPDAAGIAQWVARRPLTTLHSGLPSLAGIMRDADLMIGAGGSTTWERMALGLPAIVIGIADNQLAMNKALMEAGYIDYLGAMDVVGADDIRAAVTAALAAPTVLAARSARMMALVSADGAERVAAELFRLNEDATAPTR